MLVLQSVVTGAEGAGPDVGRMEVPKLCAGSENCCLAILGIGIRARYILPFPRYHGWMG